MLKYFQGFFLPRLAETPDCSTMEFQLGKIFADDFGRRLTANITKIVCKSCLNSKL